MARRPGLALPLVYDTSGCETAETLHFLDGAVDIHLPDFRAWDDERAFRYA